MPTVVHAVGRPDLPPLTMPDRFRRDVAYFMTPPGAAGVPALAEGEYWIRLGEASEWLDGGVLDIVSPLDSQHKTEIEITPEQEEWLEWMIAHGVEHIRLA